MSLKRKTAPKVAPVVKKKHRRELVPGTRRSARLALNANKDEEESTDSEDTVVRC